MEAHNGLETRNTKTTNIAMAMRGAGVCKLVHCAEEYFVYNVDACIGRFANWCKVLHGAGLCTVLAPMTTDSIVRSVVKCCQLFGCIVVLYHITLYMCMSTSVRTTENGKSSSAV